MAQPQLLKANRGNQGQTSQIPGSPTFEQLLRAGEASKWPSGNRHMEDDHNHTPHRKSISVLAKVKEKAKKWRQNLTSSKKKHYDDGTNTTPSWGVTLDDEDDDDPQHLASPMYESEIGPQGLKQASIKHPKAIPNCSDRNYVNITNNNTNNVQAVPLPKPNNIKNVQVSPTPSPKANSNGPFGPGSAPSQMSQGSSLNPQGNPPGSAPAPLLKSTSRKDAKTMSKGTSIKPGPANATSSDTSHVVAPKLQSIALSNNEPQKPEPHTPKSAPGKYSFSPRAKSSRPYAQGEVVAPELPAISTKHGSTDTGKKSPNSAPAAVEASRYLPSAGKQLWDKGVSVKEYILQKFEPGEDEKALSQVISKAISPKKHEQDATVIEKVREAVSSLLQNQPSSNQPNRSAYHSAQSSTSQIPPLVVAEEVTEAETLERLLQAN